MQLFSAVSNMSWAACGIQPWTLDTSCQILFCSLISALETFSDLGVDGILLLWWYFSSFIALIPKKWLKNSATKKCAEQNILVVIYGRSGEVLKCLALHLKVTF